MNTIPLFGDQSITHQTPNTEHQTLNIKDIEQDQDVRVCWKKSPLQTGDQKRHVQAATFMAHINCSESWSIWHIMCCVPFVFCHLSMTGPRSSNAGASSARGSLVSTVVDAMATYLPGLATQCENDTMHTYMSLWRLTCWMLERTGQGKEMNKSKHGERQVRAGDLSSRLPGKLPCNMHPEGLAAYVSVAVCLCLACVERAQQGITLHSVDYTHYTIRPKPNPTQPNTTQDRE